jgi:hypothetical protein
MKVDSDLKHQVGEILTLVQRIAPGKSVELRIPHYIAIQCVSGSVHRRGTPPNVVEMSAQSLINLTKNPNLWEELCSIGMISASGTNSNLKELFIQISKLSQNLGWRFGGQ